MTIAPLERCCDVSPSAGNSLYAGSEQFFSSDSDSSRGDEVLFSIGEERRMRLLYSDWSR